MSDRGKAPDEEWVELEIRGLVLDPTQGLPVVILREPGSSSFLPIWIGLFEANAINAGLEDKTPKRPATHDLLRSAVEQLGGVLERVEIHSLHEGTFFAALVIRDGEAMIRIDSRPSDALALAVRTGARIWASRAVLMHAESSADSAERTEEERLRHWLEHALPEELGKYPM